MQVMKPTTSKRDFRFGVMDIESFHWVTPVHIGFFDGIDYLHFRTVKEFLKFFLQRKYAFWKCFAHFGSGYDFNFIMESLDHDFADLRVKILSNNGITMLRIDAPQDNTAYTWTFLDSHRLLPRSLRDLSISFDVEHKKKELDRANLHLYPPEVVMEYLEYDCKGLYEILKKFQSWFSGADVPLKATIGSQAMSLYRKKMPFPLKTLPPKIEEFIRRGYFGGRTEIFKMLCLEDFYYYDVRSLYPHVMVKYPMPVGSPHLVDRYEEGSHGFYHAEIRMPDIYIPVLPLLRIQKLLFPKGSFSGVYSSLEIEAAIKLGAEVNVSSGYIFPTDFIFNDYVRKMYRLKESSDNTTKLIAKLLLNSLYGKFGQGRIKEYLIRTNQLEDIIGAKPYIREINLFTKENISRANFIIPSIAAWITSAARVELLNWLLKAGEDHVYYCDTDSVMTTRRLPEGDRLGDLKLEMKGKQAVFLQPKVYAIITDEDTLIAKVKGFEREFVKTLVFDAFESALKGDTHAFHQELKRFGRMKECLRRQGNFVSMLTKKKSLCSSYDKRIVLEDYDTEPVTIGIMP